MIYIKIIHFICQWFYFYSQVVYHKNAGIYSTGHLWRNRETHLEE